MAPTHRGPQALSPPHLPGGQASVLPRARVAADPPVPPLTPACVLWPRSRPSLALACSPPLAIPDRQQKLLLPGGWAALSQERGRFPDRLPQGWVSSATGKADRLRPREADVAQRAAQPLPHSDRRAATSCVTPGCCWPGPLGRRGKRTSRAPREKHPLRVLRLLRSVVPTCILGVAGSPALPEPQPARGSTALGGGGAGSPLPKPPSSALAPSLSTPKPERTAAGNGTGTASRGSTLAAWAGKYRAINFSS